MAITALLTALGVALTTTTATGATVATGAGIAAGIADALITGVAVGVSTGVGVAQQNAQVQYQQDVLNENAKAAQNEAAAEVKNRRTEAARAQARTRAQMAATGVSSQSGSFLDLIGQGAAAGELDVLKAKYAGDSKAWALNTEINALETQKKNAWLEGTLAGTTAALATGVSSGLGSQIGGWANAKNATVTTYNPAGTVVKTEGFKGSQMQKLGDSSINAMSGIA